MAACAEVLAPCAARRRWPTSDQAWIFLTGRCFLSSRQRCCVQVFSLLADGDLNVFQLMCALSALTHASTVEQTRLKTIFLVFFVWMFLFFSLNYVTLRHLSIVHSGCIHTWCSAGIRMGNHVWTGILLTAAPCYMCSIVLLHFYQQKRWPKSSFH